MKRWSPKRIQVSRSKASDPAYRQAYGAAWAEGWVIGTVITDEAHAREVRHMPGFRVGVDIGTRLLILSSWGKTASSIFKKVFSSVDNYAQVLASTPKRPGV